AHLVHGVRRHVPADPGADGGLSSGVLAGPRGEDLPDDDRVDRCGIDARLLQRAADREGAELRCREGGELPLQPSLRGTGGGDDDDVGHDCSFSSSETMRVGSVASMTSCTLTPGAVSTSTSPASVTSMTARSVMMRCTTPRPVSGSEHSFTIFAEPSLATCSIRMMSLPAPCTRSIAPPGPFTILPG